jgi:hypothetical protein
MGNLTEEERRELKELAASPALREDLRTLARRRARHFFRDGQVDLDLVLAFLTEFNEMINHQPKPFQAILDQDMKL